MEADDNVVRAGEAVLRRRSKSRKRKEGMVTVTTTDNSARLSWLQVMLSISPRKPLTTLHRFTFWSCLFAYFLGGLLNVLFPHFMGWAFFDEKMSDRAIEYVRLDSGLLALIGFLNMVAARSRPVIPGDGSILGTVLERIFFITAALMWNFYQSLIPLSVALMFTLLDSSLALITYVIWSRETSRASPLKCLETIAKLVLPIFNPVQKWSSHCIQMIGYVQIVISVTFLSRPQLACDALGLGDYEGYSMGLLSLYFTQTAVIGWLHVLGGGDGNDSTPIAAVFYRIVWSVPFITAMGYFGRVESGFALAIGLSDLLIALMIFFCLCIDGLLAPKQQTH